MPINTLPIKNDSSLTEQCHQSGTMHFDATYGWSRKTATFFTVSVMDKVLYLWSSFLIVIVYSPGGNRFHDFARSHYNLMYQTGHYRKCGTFWLDYKRMRGAPTDECAPFKLKMD